MRYARANPSTQQTNTSLVAVANPVQVIKTKTIYISSDTEMEVSLSSSDSASILFKQYVGARGGTVLPLELEVPTAPREAQLSWAELEVATAPRRALVSWAELEAPTAPRRVLVSWAEVETPTAPRVSVLTWAEFEAPDAVLADSRAVITWVVLEVPLVGGDGDVRIVQVGMTNVW